MIFLSGFLYGGGYLVSFNDVGGPLAGIIYGVANTIAMIAGFLAPFLMGILTTEVIHIFILTYVNLRNTQIQVLRICLNILKCI